MGFLAALVLRAVNFAVDWLTEKDVRRRKEKIRSTKRRMLAERAKLQELARNIRLERGRMEHLRRGALIRYYEAQRDLIDIARDALEDAKRSAYNHLKVVEDRLDPRSEKPRSFIHAPLFNEFKLLKTKVHGAIAESKALTSQLNERKALVCAELDELHDARTHGRLGAKKKIEALLDALHRDGRHQLAASSARDTVLKVGHASYILERRCGGCRAWLSDAMAFCPLCGEEQPDTEPVRFYKKDTVADLACPSCNAPSAEELAHCFNCGTEQDHFGLRNAL